MSQAQRNEIHTAVVFVTVASAFCAAASAAQFTTMQPGRYELTWEAAMAGRAGKTPPRTETMCISADDMKDWSRRVVNRGDSDTCRLIESKMDGNHLTFTRECTAKSGAKTTFKGDVTFTPPDVYKSVTQVSSSGGASSAFLQGTTIASTARRIGECVK